ncbi:glycosyltransferase family 4 protein [Bacillus sp. CHD6a]|uniref:glycosyltransferase family 4 protein n=1 Tax=Bacillus sp. CHD6a TaxID=1643452 RepID=UPI000761BF5D|nr:MraY family glycosyltransferase [Bacillus sp. CHD6a]
MNISELVSVFLICFMTVLLVTPLVIKIALKLGVTDKPDQRKVHQKLMPRLGGLAIFAGLTIGYLISDLDEYHISSISFALIIIVITGILDDAFQISALKKLFGQILASLIIIQSGLLIEFLYVPFFGTLQLLDISSYIITFIWIIVITNALNLIDGLDGLAAGVSCVILITILGSAISNEKVLISTLAVIILGSTLGFLPYNFNPAKIFMGDTGSLLLGFSIAVISLLGMYKSVALFNITVTTLILGVPVFDTVLAIIRRLITKKPITQPDKKHLHHQILSLGFSHRNTVLLIYCISSIFSILALFLNRDYFSVVFFITIIIGITGSIFTFYSLKN